MAFHPSGVLTFSSDFGHADPFVGVLHGVASWIAPSVQRVDLSHGIPRGDVRAGAFWLALAARWFAPGTVHVAIVDPGVGTERAALVVLAHGHAFVGPDNGLLAEAQRTDPGARAFALPLPEAASATFHGRDVFAPTGARIASGALDPTTLPTAPPTVPSPVPSIAEQGAQVVVVDRFGNLITNVPGDWLAGARVLVGAKHVPSGRTYGSVPEGELVAVVNSWGLVEIAKRGGSAAEALSAGPGTAVSFDRS